MLNGSIPHLYLRFQGVGTRSALEIVRQHKCGIAQESRQIVDHSVSNIPVFRLRGIREVCP